MSAWRDVEEIAADLPGAKAGFAHDLESPTYDVGRHPFARLRWDEDREILQVWAADAGIGQAMQASEPSAVLAVHVFPKKASLWLWLDQVDPVELRELVIDSWAVRAPRWLVRERLG